MLVRKDVMPLQTSSTQDIVRCTNMKCFIFVEPLTCKFLLWRLCITFIWLLKTPFFVILFTMILFANIKYFTLK